MENNPAKNIKKRFLLGKLKLNTLLEVTKGINNNFSKKELIELYTNVLVKELNIGKILLFISSDTKWNKELALGVKDTPITVDDLKDLIRITVLNNTPNERLAEFDVALPIYHKSQPLAYLLLGDFDGEKIEVSPIIKHLSFIQTLTNIIVVAVENKRLYKENINQIAIQKEMELASEMQNMLFPNTFPNNSSVEVAAKYLPHHQVGGDYYDFIELNDHEIAFCIADVSGKGVPAALVMSNFQACLRALIKRTSSLTELVTELNQNILNNAKREKFITAFIGRYNLKTRNLQYINAGHNPPNLMVNGIFTDLIDGTTILGMFDHLPSITEKSIVMPEQAVLVCFTDGVTEQTDKNEIEFGEEKLQSSIFMNKKESIDTILNNIVEKINQYKQDVNYKDDIALLGIRFK